MAAIDILTGDMLAGDMRSPAGKVRNRRSSVLPSKQKRPMNKAWHDCHRMPRTAKIDEKIEWHIAHKQHCGCRDIPATIRRKMIEHGIVEHPVGFNVGRDDHFHPDTDHLAGHHRLID